MHIAITFARGFGPAVSLATHGNDQTRVPGVNERMARVLEKGRRRDPWPGRISARHAAFVALFCMGAAIVLAVAVSKGAGIVVAVLAVVLLALAGRG